MSMRSFSRFLALALISLALSPNSYAESRVFTSPDGRTLEAEILSATVDMVSLKTTAGVTIAAPISKFIDADREAIADWRKQNPTFIKYGFATLFSKDKLQSKKVRDGVETLTEESWICNMRITNKSGETLNNVKVDYIIYYDAMEGSQKVTRKEPGSTIVPSIKHLQELVVPTKEVKLTVTQLDSNYYYSDGSRSRKRDAVKAMKIDLTHEGKKVFTWVSPNAPAEAGSSGSSLFK